MNTHDIELPEHDCLYEATNENGFIDVEPAYRKSTVLRLIEADRKRRGEPVAGYTMVPVEPTPQMIAAFRSGFQNELHKNDRRRTMSAEEAGLRAMLKATPQPSDPSGAPTLHNADSGAQNGIQATQPAEPLQCTWANVHPDCAARKHAEPYAPEDCGIDSYLRGLGIEPEKPAEPVKTLVDNQEPLGEEFQRVLDENRWDLYEKSTEPVKVPSDAELLDLATLCGINHSVIDADYCRAVGLPDGTRHIADEVRPERTVHFARALLARHTTPSNN